MALIDFTSYDEVRLALGVSSDELEDESLGLPFLESALKADFRSIDSSLVDTIKTIAALKRADRSDAQQWLLESSRLFATYSVAKQLSSGLPMFGPKDISDGKATVSRFADSPYKAVLAAVKSEYDKQRLTLEVALAGMQNSTKSSTVPTYIRVVSPSVDPVTGQ